MNNYSYHLEFDSGDFFSRNLTLFSTRKNDLFYGEEQVSVSSTFPAAPFDSIKDFQNKLKAPVVMAIVSASSLVQSALSVVKNLTLAVLNTITLDFEQAETFFIKTFIDLMGVIYFAFSIILDTCYAIASLVTQVIVTGYVWATNSDTLETEIDYNLNPEGFSDRFLNTSCAAMKISLSKEDGLESYLDSDSIGFFQSFDGDFQTQFKAPLVIPISYLTTAIQVKIGAVTKIVLTLVNCAVLDFEQAGTDLKVAGHGFESAIHFVLSAIVDTLYATTKLITRTLTTVNYALGSAIDREQTQETPIFTLLP